jgi:ATP-dependent DNA helicase RecG
MKNIEEQLNYILSLPAENEIVEWKEAKNDFDFRKLGKYFSALCNEANLKNKKSAWLVFGIKDDKTVVGTNYRKNSVKLHSLKSEIAKHITTGISFIEIYETKKMEEELYFLKFHLHREGFQLPGKDTIMPEIMKSLFHLVLKKLIELGFKQKMRIGA